MLINSKKRGFSLSEAIMSLVVLGIFFGFMIPVISGRSDSSGITGYFADYDNVGVPVMDDKGSIVFEEASNISTYTINDGTIEVITGYKNGVPEYGTFTIKRNNKGNKIAVKAGKSYVADDYGEPVAKHKQIYSRISNFPKDKDGKSCVAIRDITDFEEVRNNPQGCYILMDDINFEKIKDKKKNINYQQVLNQYDKQIVAVQAEQAALDTAYSKKAKDEEYNKKKLNYSNKLEKYQKGKDKFILEYEKAKANDNVWWHNKTEWTPIPDFSGILFGNGKIMYNLQGTLFNTLSGKAVLQDFGIHDSLIMEEDGVLLANKVETESKVTIRNVYTQGIMSTGTMAAGLIGSNSGDLRLILVGNTSNLDATAGLVWANLDGKISFLRCYNVGTIQAKAYAGGFLGYSKNGNIDIKYSYNAGDIITSYKDEAIEAGGFIGKIELERSAMDVNIKESYSSGKIDVLNYDMTKTTNKPTMAGGFIGLVKSMGSGNMNLKISDSYFAGAIGTALNRGGIIGRVFSYLPTTNNNSANIEINNTYVLASFKDIAGNQPAAIIGAAGGVNLTLLNVYYFPNKAYTNVKKLEVWNEDKTNPENNNKKIGDVKTVKENSIKMTVELKGANKYWFQKNGRQDKLFTTFANRSDVWMLDKKYRPFLTKIPETMMAFLYNGEEDSKEGALPLFLANRFDEEDDPEQAFIDLAIEEYKDENSSLKDKDEIVINTFFNLDMLCESGVLHCGRTINKREWNVSKAVDMNNQTYNNTAKCTALKAKVEDLLKENNDTDTKKLRRYLQHINCQYYDWMKPTYGTCASRTPLLGGYARWGLTKNDNNTYKICTNPYPICNATFHVNKQLDDSIEDNILPRFLKQRLLEALKLSGEFRNPIRVISNAEINCDINSNCKYEWVAISSKEDLAKLAQYSETEGDAKRCYDDKSCIVSEDMSGNSSKRRYVLTKDIDFKSTDTFKSLGSNGSDSDWVGFSGNFNGNGHTITGADKAFIHFCKRYKGSGVVHLYNLQIKNSTASEPFIDSYDRAYINNLSLKCTINSCKSSFKGSSVYNRSDATGNPAEHSLDEDATNKCEDIIDP